MLRKIVFGLMFFKLLFGYAQIEKDKALHFLGGNLYGLVGSGIANQISGGNKTWSFVGAVGGSLLVGLGKEAIDQKQYDGWDNQDLFATVLGGTSIGVTIHLFKSKKERKYNKIYKNAVGYDFIGVTTKHPIKPIGIKSLTLLGVSSGVLNRKS